MGWGRLRRVLDVAIGLVLVLLAAIGALRWVDSTSVVVAVLQTCGPFVVVGLGLLLVGTAMLRRWWMLVPVGLVLVVALVQAVPPFFASTTPTANRVMTVMGANLDFGGADAEQVMAAVRARAADVLVLTEVTPEAVAKLDRAGLDSALPHHVGEARGGTFTGTLIYSRYAMTETSPGDGIAEATPSLQPEVTLSVLGTPVRLKAVHLAPPVAPDIADWRAGLRALQEWKQAQPGDERLVLVGDFNASFGHPGFRAVADGLEDAQRVDGGGWVRTWPVVGQRLPAYVQTDHVLSRGLVVMDAGQEEVHGTDHAIVWGAYAFSATTPRAPAAPTS